MKLNEEKKKAVERFYLSSNYTTTSTSLTVPFSSRTSWGSTSAYTLNSDGTITINRSINLLIDTHVLFTSATAGTKRIEVYKNSTTIDYAPRYVSSSYCGLSSSCMYSFSAGDVLKITLNCTSGDILHGALYTTYIDVIEL